MEATEFKKIVEEYSRPLYAHIRRIVQNHEDTNDVLQNTFIKAWQSIDTFRGDCKLSTWLFRIAYNESLTLLSKRREQQGLDDGEVSVADRLMSDPYFDGDETMAQFQEAIASLPDKQKLVFTLKYFDEMKYEDMSERLGTSVGALKASYHHAVKKIQDFFASHD